MASLSIDFSEQASLVFVKSTVTMDVVFPEPSEGWPHELNGVSGGSISSLFLEAVSMANVNSINTTV